MKCFFYYSNSYFAYAYLASAMHMGILPNQPPFPSDSIKQLQPCTHGKRKPLYAGKDSCGNNIYAVWNVGAPEMVMKMISSFLQAYDIPQASVVFSNLGIKDDLLSLTTNLMVKYGNGQLYTWLVKTILARHYPQIALAVGRSCHHNLTKTASYQIMLP
ncbi:MAG: DUF3189 family protein [Firmicutes bacterium]|nr:DUF3189 family protein [Bacillota bacterium]